MPNKGGNVWDSAAEVIPVQFSQMAFLTIWLETFITISSTSHSVFLLLSGSNLLVVGNRGIPEYGFPEWMCVVNIGMTKSMTLASIPDGTRTTSSSSCVNAKNVRYGFLPIRIFMTWRLLPSRHCSYRDQLSLCPWSSCVPQALPPGLSVWNNPTFLFNCR